MKSESLLGDEKGTNTLRKSGIEVVGDIHWGTHLCQFYETKEDLIDILVPYFAEGLRSNEFCMWVTSPPLGVEEARAALRKAVPDLEQYMKKGQIEILPYTDWYLLGGEFDADRVLEGWVEKEKGALDRGFAGLRLTGNTFWIERNCWKSFVDYEATVNEVIGEQRMIAICSYSLEKCTGSDVVDVMRNHESVLIKRGETWILAEDVYTRRLLEKKVAESQTRLKNVFAVSPDAITVSDLSGNIVDCNQATLDMGGFSSKDEVIGKNALEFIAKKDHRRATENLKKTLEQGSVKNIEYTFLAKDGREYPVELSASVIKDPSGNPTGFVAITKDITERKKTEEKIRASEERYRSLVELAPDGIVTLDMKGIITSCNSVATRMTGYSKDEIGGKHFSKLGFLRAEDIPKYLKLQSPAERGKVPKSLEVNCIRKDGTPYSAEVHFGSLTEGGKTIGFQVIGRDITERKRTEEALRESEETLRNLFESAGDGILTLDFRGRITSINKKVEEISGFRRDEIIGKHITKFAQTGIISLKDIPWILKAFTARIKGQPTKVYELRIKNKKGQGKIIDFRGSLIKKRGKPVGILEIIRDVTETKKAEERIRESEEKYRNLFENARDLILTLDLEGNVTSANNVLLEYGYDKSEVIGASVFDFVPEEYLQQFRDNFRELARGKPVEGEFKIKSRRRQGYIFAEYRSNPIIQDNKVVGVQTIVRDITERKLAGEALRESEEKLRGIFSTMPDGITLVGLDGRISDCNDAVLRLHGVSKDEYVGKSVYDFIALEDRQRAIQEASVVLEKGFIRSEVKALRKKGGTFDAEINVSLLRNASGEPMAFLGVTRDITERKKMEEGLRESEERFRNLFQSIQNPVGVYVGREGRLIDHNKAFNRLSGYTDEELKDKAFLDFVHPEDQAMVLERYRTKYSEEELPLVYELRAVNKKGETIPIEINVSTYRVKGKVVGIEVIHRDITERKKMEEKLRQYSEHLEELVQKRTEELLESEKRYSVLVEEASDGVGIIQDGKVIFVNKKAAEIVGYSKDELIGLPFEKAVDEKYLQLAMEGYMGRLQGETLPAIAELELIAKTGERVPIEASSTLIHYQGRPATLVIMRDIRERKRMEEEHLRLEKLATIGELATMVGHDLRNPLQAIENATYYLNNELPRLPPFTPIPQKALEMLQVINDSVNYADKIIRDLHDFSATKKPTLKKTNINAVVKETLSQVEAPENVELITELGHLPEIKADKDMIKRAFLNLAINGIQAMEKGGTLKVSTKKTKGFVEVSFKDTGIGIPKEDMKKIFTPFFTTRAKGMGMGLPICKKFVEIHGGSIEVESQEGKGSTFTVKLPIQQENGGETGGEE